LLSMKLTGVLAGALGMASAQMDGQAMTVSVNPGPGKMATVVLGSQDANFVKLVDDGNSRLTFSQKESVLLTFDAGNTTITQAAKNLTGTIRADGSLSVNGTLYADDMDVDSSNDLSQWALIYHDMFHENTAGWSTNFTSTCGSPFKILGGHCKLSKAEVQKSYDKLPSHKAVRVVARYYFIDDWDDYTGYMKMDGKYLWTQEYAHCKMPFRLLCTKSKSICGKEDDPDKIGHLIDVAHPHTEDSVEVTFGSTMEYVDPCDCSYGVQGVSIYVR